MKLRNLTAGAGAALAGYAFFVRPRHLRWGATDKEIARALPFDGQIPWPAHVTNRAVTIAAGPEHVWPWLAQIGERPRGGFYSYAWIERLMGMEVANADCVLPEFQQVTAGDVIDRTGYLTVRAVVPGRYLVLGPPESEAETDSTWALVLYPLVDGTTRLLSRTRVRLPGDERGLSWYALLEPMQFLMERKMLLEIKRRAEALAAAEAVAGLSALGAQDVAPAVAQAS